VNAERRTGRWPPRWPVTRSAGRGIWPRPRRDPTKRWPGRWRTRPVPPSGAATRPPRLRPMAAPYPRHRPGPPAPARRPRNPRPVGRAALGTTRPQRTPRHRDRHHDPARHPGGQLTAQERQIATLAATGLTNKQIGQRLFLSHRTVGAHLHRAFPKLGITSRAALRDALDTIAPDDNDHAPQPPPAPTGTAHHRVRHHTPERRRIA
jgi:DNA-binding CsgD family transcriptional regulator